MSRRKISTGVVHEVPADLRKALTSDRKALTAWEISHRSHATSGYVGLSQLKKQKLEAAESSGPRASRYFTMWKSGQKAKVHS